MWLERAKPYSISQWICINKIHCDNTLAPAIVQVNVYGVHSNLRANNPFFHIAVRSFLRIMMQNNPYFYAQIYSSVEEECYMNKDMYNVKCIDAVISS
jgi:hypothetical protein